LLRSLAGLETLIGGRVLLDGTVLEDSSTGSRVPPEERSIGVVFQDYRLFPHLSALDNVAFGLRSRGLRRSAANRRAAGWLERVGLAPQAAAKPAQLSGGQAQRVALARALATDPALLLLDEPLAALDATTRVETRRHLKRHLRDHDGVRIVVTHDSVDAAALADRIVVLEQGRTVQAGSLAELTQHPRSRYVADLVGVNLVAAHAAEGRVEMDGFTLTLADRISGDVLVAVPPRAVVLSRTRPAGSARNVWPGVVDDVDLLGDRGRVIVRGPLAIVAEVTTAAIRELSLAEGSHVWVAVKATEIQASRA
jgi:molybdate transport system ATP-binding protein